MAPAAIGISVIFRPAVSSAVPSLELGPADTRKPRSDEPKLTELPSDGTTNAPSDGAGALTFAISVMGGVTLGAGGGGSSVDKGAGGTGASGAGGGGGATTVPFTVAEDVPPLESVMV